MNHPMIKSFLAVGAVALALNVSGCGSTSSDSFAGGNGGNNNPAPVVVASKSIGAAGGTLAVTDPTSPLVGSSIVIPPGALANPTTITISDAPGGGGFPAGTVPLNFGPSGTQFALPVTVTLRYTQAYLNANGIVDPTTLKIVSSDPGMANETLRTTAQDTANFTLTAQTTHFSTLAAVGYSNATLKGTYSLAEYYKDGTSDNVVIPLNVPPFSNSLSVNFPIRGYTVQSSLATFDGAGGVTITQSVRNQDGTVSSLPGETATYSVSPDGTLTVPQMRGSVLAGGSTLVLASTSGTPQISIGVKKEGAFSNASLASPYTLVEYSSDITLTNMVLAQYNIPPSPPRVVAYTDNLLFNFVIHGFTSSVSTAIFDGAGGVAVSETRNHDGTITSVAQSAGYAVAPEGTLTVPGLSGTVLAGGSALIMTSSAAGSTPQISVAIKKGGSFSNASLKGKYTIAEYSSQSHDQTSVVVPYSVPAGPSNTQNLSANYPTKGFTSSVSTATFDGNGGVALSTTHNQDGVVTTTTQTATYSVAADGTLTVPEMTGSVLAGGSTFVLGATTPGSETQISVGILK